MKTSPNYQTTTVTIGRVDLKKATQWTITHRVADLVVNQKVHAETIEDAVVVAADLFGAEPDDFTVHADDPRFVRAIATLEVPQ
jgi:HSP20 family molecular chaperone IbpA